MSVDLSAEAEELAAELLDQAAMRCGHQDGRCQACRDLCRAAATLRGLSSKCERLEAERDMLLSWKVKVVDAGAFSHVSPSQMVSYLEVGGWEQTAVLDGRATVWHCGMFEILLPIDRELRDYIPRIADAIQTIAIREARSELAVLQEVLKEQDRDG